MMCGWRIETVDANSFARSAPLEHGGRMNSGMATE